jgi:hypothetical protein
MKRTVSTFGLISGAIISVLMTVGLVFADRIGFDKSEVLGYTSIVLSMLMVFFGVRSYRDNAAGGAITFGRAFTVGILITVISCGFYVVTWEILYYNFMPDFMDKYAAYAAERAKASGASPDAVAAQVAQIQQYKELYANPILNAALTSLEPFPIGLAVTLISAAILRRRRPQNQALRTPQPVDSKN